MEPQFIATIKNQLESIQEIVRFYNKHFPESQHSESYKLSNYINNSIKPIIITIRVETKIIGLFESWLKDDNSGTRKLVTLLVDPKFRGHKFGDRLFFNANEIAHKEQSGSYWILHFRDSNRAFLEPYYSRFGFKEICLSGNYTNGEQKWEMRRRVG